MENDSINIPFIWLTIAFVLYILWDRNDLFYQDSIDLREAESSLLVQGMLRGTSSGRIENWEN